MGLLRAHLPAEAERCREQGVRLVAIGRRDRLPEAVRRAVEDAEACTAGGRRLEVRLALDYSAREALARAAALLPEGPVAGRGAVAQALAAACHAPAMRDVDLLIRTGGEQRLSDFLLWECAYAELYFTRTLWPDFDGEALRAAVEAFHCRERRFGAVPVPS